MRTDRKLDVVICFSTPYVDLTCEGFGRIAVLAHVFKMSPLLVDQALAQHCVLCHRAPRLADKVWLPRVGNTLNEKETLNARILVP